MHEAAMAMACRRLYVSDSLLSLTCASSEVPAEVVAEMISEVPTEVAAEVPLEGAARCKKFVVNLRILKHGIKTYSLWNCLIVL